MGRDSNERGAGGGIGGSRSGRRDWGAGLGSRGFDKRLMQVNSRIQQAFTQISKITDNAVAEFSNDVAKMAQQLIRDDTKKTKNSRSTGALANSVRAARHGDLLYSVDTGATNNAGHGYGAAQEWGWINKRSRRAKKGKTRAGQKKRGKHSIVRATFGMVKRWQRGERWRD